MKKKNKSIYKYELGSFVNKDNPRLVKFADGGFFSNNQAGLSSAGYAASGMITSIEDPAKANVGGSVASGALSGAAAGAVLGPWGAAAGGVIGAGVGLVGGLAKKKKIEATIARNKVINQNNYNTAYNSMLDTDNENPNGIQEFALGGIIDPEDTTPKRTKTKVNPGDATYDPSLLGTNGQFMVQKPQGTILNGIYNDTGQWGYDLGQEHQVNFVPKPLSNKALGTDNTYTPARDHQTRTTDIPMIKPSWRYEDGSDVQNNLINIEKGELLIDPNKGTIKQEYKGINPLTGGLFEPHAKKEKDESFNNITKANEGDFIITKKKAKIYKDAVDNNDSITKSTILMNIRNNKIQKEGGLQKYADGSDILGIGKNIPSYTDPNYTDYSNYNRNFGLTSPDLQSVNPNVVNNFRSNIGVTPVNSNIVPNYIPPEQTSSNTFGNILNNIGKYGPALSNLGQGMFGKTYETPQQGVLTNPYINKILSNMPHNINTQPIINEIYNNQRGEVADLKNNTNSSAIYRANRANIGINTNKQIIQAKLQAQEMNNQIGSQRAQTYGQLGQEIVGQQDRTRQLNLGIDQQNNQAKVAKQNIFNTGLSQLQQIGQNDKYNNQKMNMDKYNLQLLAQIFPNLKNYSQFDANTILDQLNKKN